MTICPLLILLNLTMTCAAAGNVLPGIDVIAATGFAPLQGKRVGLITNHTGRNIAGVSTIDLLFKAPGVTLVAIFTPEHGLRGEADSRLPSGVDPATGLPLYSLYGSDCRPNAGMLKGIDLLVFDIQDIGTRFYTYIGTLSLAMQSASSAGIPFMVLDRPNPVGGVAVQGATPPFSAKGGDGSGCRTLTSIHPIPTRHGMTVGELALLFNRHFAINASLEVIPLKGWKRSHYFDETGLGWINPSPNMKSLKGAILYPGLGILEALNLSVGRGTERPFEMYGAPWADSALLLKNLSERDIPGISFSACSFTPTAPGHPYRGKICHGVCVGSIDRDRLDPVMAGLHLLQAFYETHPGQLKPGSGFALQAGDGELWELLTLRKATPDQILNRWRRDIERFRVERQQFLLYI